MPDINILVVDDEKEIADLIEIYLVSDGYKVFKAENAARGLEILEKEEIHLVLLDIMMPGMNGYELIRQVRAFSNLPILILSARTMDADKVLGLDVGADAYLTKPFNALEVVAYVKAALRRYYELGAGQSRQDAPHTLTLGDLELDTAQFILRKNGETVPLTSTELKILARLMSCPGRVFTKAQLYECVGGAYYESDDNTMMVHISNLRAKIEDDPANPKYIKTVRGLGYKIEGQ